jgi:hypothetical protein
MISGSTILAGERRHLFQGTRCPDLLGLYRADSTQHVVQFYEDETFVIENVAFLAAKALAAGHSSVLIATEPHLQGFQSRMTEFGMNVKSCHESGRFVTIEAEQALSLFMMDGNPDETRFLNAIGGVLGTAEKHSTTGFVFAFGEMVALLCSAGNPRAAIRLEQLWNSLARHHRFSLYCAYSLNCLGHQPSATDLIDICYQHALTIPSETSL